MTEGPSEARDLSLVAAEDPPRAGATLRPAMVNLPPTRGTTRGRTLSVEARVRGLRPGPPLEAALVSAASGTVVHPPNLSNVPSRSSGLQTGLPMALNSTSLSSHAPPPRVISRTGQNLVSSGGRTPLARAHDVSDRGPLPSPPTSSNKPPVQTDLASTSPMASRAVQSTDPDWLLTMLGSAVAAARRPSIHGRAPTALSST
jgi:hypothetical protein